VEKGILEGKDNEDGEKDEAASSETNDVSTEELAIKIDEEIKSVEQCMRPKYKCVKKNMNTPNKKRKLEKRARILC